MGFDFSLVPDWARPYVGYVVGMDWPEGDEESCFRIADAYVSTVQSLLLAHGERVFTRPGEDWDGEALEAFVERVDKISDPTLQELVRQLVMAARFYNDVGVQVQYTKRMIEVSVWFLIFQIGWLLAVSAGPQGVAALSLIHTRVQLTRLAIAQLGRRLLINIALFGGLMAGMDVAVQASQSRREDLDWEQIMMSGGTGALLGGFLTAFTGLVPARSMLGLMGRSGMASGATDLTVQLGSGRPLDFDQLFKSVTSGVLGGADAHWASWSPFAHGRPDTTTTLADTSTTGTPTAGTSSAGGSFTSQSPGTHTAGHGLPPSRLTGGNAHLSAPSSNSAALSASIGAQAGVNAVQGAGVAGGKSPSSPFQILDDPGRSGDGYVSGGLWGKYGAAGVLIRAMDGGEPHYLLMQQSEYVSNAGKWQLPGGALDSLETPVQAAARELSEELGVNQSYLNRLQLKGEHAVEVGGNGWTYTNLAAEGQMFQPKLDPFEASDAKWFTRQQLYAMANQGQLHPALAKALPDLLALYHTDGGADPPAPPKDHYTAPGATRIKPPVDFATRAVPGDPFGSGHPPGKESSPPSYSGLVSDRPHPSPEYIVRSTASGLYYAVPAPHVPLDAPFGARLVDPSFGAAVWGDVHRGLSSQERAVSQDYTGSRYWEMNKYLRGQPLPDLNGQELASVAGDIEVLNGILRRQPVPETIDVFRGLYDKPYPFTVPVDELPGTVQRDPAFFSTNLGDRAVFGSAPLILHLRVPPGTPAFYLQLLSTLGERELLLGSDVSYFVEDVQRKDGKWLIYGWVLPPDKSGG